MTPVMVALGLFLHAGCAADGFVGVRPTERAPAQYAPQRSGPAADAPKEEKRANIPRDTTAPAADRRAARSWIRPAP